MSHFSLAHWRLPSQTILLVRSIRNWMVIISQFLADLLREGFLDRAPKVQSSLFAVSFLGSFTFPLKHLLSVYRYHPRWLCWDIYLPGRCSKGSASIVYSRRRFVNKWFEAFIVFTIIWNSHFRSIIVERERTELLADRPVECFKRRPHAHSSVLYRWWSTILILHHATRRLDIGWDEWVGG